MWMTLRLIFNIFLKRFYILLVVFALISADECEEGHQAVGGVCPLPDFDNLLKDYPDAPRNLNREDPVESLKIVIEYALRQRVYTDALVSAIREYIKTCETAERLLGIEKKSE